MKRKIKTFYMLLFYFCNWSMPALSEDNMEEVASISGIYFDKIQIASVEFKNKGYEIANYNIIVFKHQNSFFVLFKSQDFAKGFRGSPSGSPGFEVEIDQYNNKILRSNFIR